MPRVKLFNEAEARRKAMELFWEKGYGATSLTDLTTHLNISKGSFYDTFGSKRALFDTCFNEYRDARMNGLKALLESEPDVKTGLRKMLELNLDELLSDQKFKGCLAANTSSEMAGIDESLRNDMIIHHQEMQKILTTYIGQATLKMGISPEVLADTVMTFLVGMNQETKYKRNRQSFQSSIELILKSVT